MSLYFHGNAPLKFQHQYLVTLNYIIPYLEAKKVFREGMKVLEIGCGEGGVLKAFIERGCICTGMDLSESKIENGKKLLSDEIAAGKMELFTADIYDEKVMDAFRGKFDLIVLKDTYSRPRAGYETIARLFKGRRRFLFCLPALVHAFWGASANRVNQIGQNALDALVAQKYI